MDIPLEPSRWYTGLTTDTLIVWTEPTTNLDIALSFQDAEGCEDIWQFIGEVQRHLNNLPGTSPIAPHAP